MCDNSLIADQFRQRLNEATTGVDEALESVRALREAILKQAKNGGTTYLDETPERVTEVVEVITRTSADGIYKLPHRSRKEMCSVCATKTAEVSIYTGDELYISQTEYLQLMKCKDQVTRIKDLHKPCQTSLGTVCFECRDQFGNLITWPCDTARLLA
jgi:hypothetical protein